VILKDLEIFKFQINNNNELEIIIKDVFFFCKTYVQVFYSIYTNESFIDIDGWINLIKVKLVFDDLNKENPIP